MQEPIKTDTGPVVLNIRITGRWMPLLSAVTVFALLPAMSASAPIEQTSPQPLAGSPQDRVKDVAEAVAASLSGVSSPLVEATRVGIPLGVGGGVMDFPDIQLGLGVPSAGTLSGTPGVGSARSIPASPFVKRPGFIWPIVGPVMSVFGPRRHPVLGIAMFHTGIDLAASCGTPIRAAADGRVSYSGTTPSWGQRIIVEHDPQLKTGYAHLSKRIAQQGEFVRQGQVIGLVGTTGWSTGCHLHFDVIVNERYVDPRPYLGLGGARSSSVPYRAAPHNVSDGRGNVIYTVEDGDVPIPSATDTTTQPPSTPSTTSPTTGTTSPSPTTTSPTTTSPTTSTPTTTSPTTTTPTTSTPTTTSEPPPPTTTTSEPPPPTTTTSEPPPPTTTTSEPPPPTTTTTTSEPTSEPAPTTNAAEPTTSEPTSEPAPTTNAVEPSSTASATEPSGG